MSLASFTSDVLRSNLPGARRPFKLTLVLNYACNCRCSMCNIWQRSSRGEMNAAEVERFFERQGRWTWINLSGGEILMKKEAEEIVASVCRLNRRLFLLDFPTTGFRPDRLESLARIALDGGVGRLAVTVSLDGPEEVHDGIRRSPGLFRTALEGFRRLRALGDRRLVARLGMTLSPENAGRVAETREAVAKLVPEFRPEELHLNLAQTSEHYYDNAAMSELSAPEGRAEALAAIEEHARIARARGAEGLLERRFRGDLAEFCGSGASAYSCRSLRSSVFVDPFWNVYPCITWNRSLGNLRECDFDLEGLLAGAEAEVLRREIAARRCPDCWTACEALPTILGHLPRAGLRLAADALRKNGERR